MTDTVMMPSKMVYSSMVTPSSSLLKRIKNVFTRCMVDLLVKCRLLQALKADAKHRGGDLGQRNFTAPQTSARATVEDHARAPDQSRLAPRSIFSLILSML